MAAAKARFKLYDVVTATDMSLQTAHANGFTCPPTDELVVLGFAGEMLVLSDGSKCWHHSHFYKIGEKKDLQETLEAIASEIPLPIMANIDAGTFNEFGILEEIREYIAKTYGEHYAKDGVQAFSLISKRPERGLHFAVSNVIKYSDRFGEKDGMNRKDLFKVVHYGILAIHCLDKLKGAA